MAHKHKTRVRKAVFTLLLAMSCLLAALSSQVFEPAAAQAATLPTHISSVAANDCVYTSDVNRTWDMGGGFYVNIHAGMCYDGTTAWINYGPDCRVNIPAWAVTATSEVTWCGLWVNQNNPFETNLGVNFNIRDLLGVTLPVLGPIGITLCDAGGWYRVPFYGDGTVGNDVGGSNC